MQHDFAVYLHEQRKKIMQNHYAVFLRAVNVSGKNLIKMSELRETLLQHDFDAVKTYIQSGNLLVSTLLSPIETELQIQRLISERFGFSIEIIVYDEQQLSNALADDPFDKQLPGNRVFLTLLKEKPTAERVNALEQLDLGEEKIEIKDQIVYFYLPMGMANSKLSNNFIEKQLQVKSTGRNRNTMERVLDLLKDISE